MVCLQFAGAFGVSPRQARRGVERGSEALFLAIVLCALPEARTSDAGRAMAADNLAALIFARKCRKRKDPG